MDKSICVFGASSTQGFYDTEKGGWVERLKSFLFEKTLKTGDYYEVFNLGISGDTSRELLARFGNEIKFRRPSIIIISIGDNDSALKVPLDEFERNIKDIVNKAKKLTDKVLILGCKKVNEKLTNPVAWDKDVAYTNETIKEYDDRLEELSKKIGVSYLKMFELLDYNDLEDGVHPNSAGHEKIFEYAKKFMIKAGWL